MMIETLVLLTALAAQPVVPGAPPPRPSADPPPTTVVEAIDRCELLEYPAPAQALKVAEAGLALGPTDAQRGLLLACRTGSLMGLGRMEEARALTLEIDPLIGPVEEDETGGGADGGASQAKNGGGDPRDRIGLIIRLSQLHFRGGDPISALEAIEQALEFAEAEHLDDDVPQVLGNLAILLTESGQFEPAIAHFERILELAEAEPQAGDPPTIPLVPVRFNLSRALLFAERPEEALPHLEWLVEAMNAPGMEPRRATALGMLGAAYGRLGDQERADAAVSEAEALLEDHPNPGELSSLRGEQALLAFERGDLVAAESHGREALALSRQIEYERSILNSLQRLVDILAARGKHAEALELHREYAGRNEAFLEDTQRSRLDLLETRLGVQRQAAELDELLRAAELQQLRLEQESFRRRIALASLIAVAVFAVLIAIWQRTNQRRLLKISRTDSLTGLPNRRYLTLQMHELGENLRRGSLMLIDLDHFKTINDTRGHDIGDRVLTEVSARIQSIAGEHGALCGRWGGEEFAVFLPESDAGSAGTLAETLRSAIEALDVEDTEGLRVPVTASLGFAPIHGLQRDSGQDIWEPALKCADQLLYRAKHAGRNRGYGAWPTSNDVTINPLALDRALKTEAFHLVGVPE